MTFHRLRPALPLAVLFTGVALPAAAVDIGAHLIGFSAWCGTALPATLVGARLVGRLLDQDKPVPAGAWLASFLVWVMLASVAGGIGLTWLWLALLPGLLWVGAHLAVKDGWPWRAAWLWTSGTFAAFGAYVLLGRGILSLGERWAFWGWWVLIIPVWITWLRLRTIPIARHTPPVPGDPSA
ncbi:MAG: hypothetical protein H7338_04120 [Candidatus Sericytochromatia bacterium]|nr:hypothetical protein [Candidatus Sericytochromatia bacterium]